MKSPRVLQSEYTGSMRDRASASGTELIESSVSTPLVNHFAAKQYEADGATYDDILIHNQQYAAQLQVNQDELARIKKELLSCQQQLDIANQAKSQFMANMSHELRTPMNGIIGMTELLENAKLEEREKRFVGAISSSASSLLHIINDLLDFSRMEAGGLHLESSRFNLRDCIEDVCSIMAPSAHEKGIELICYVDDNVPKQLDGDAGRVRQVLTNLIGNAISFTEKGEVVVRLVKLEEVDGKQTFQCDVQDSGVGILPELQITLFEAFTQADTTAARCHGGLGMGLAITQELVNLFGGSISFKSRVGEGSRFTFTMQLGMVDSTDSLLPPQRDLQGARILVVDDNETNRTILYHQLSGWGINVDCVDSGEKALQKMMQSVKVGTPYDVLVLDYQMPSMDGIELARAIANDSLICGVKALMLSSAVPDLSAEELAEINIERYISKPARQSLVHDTLRSLMPRYAHEKLQFEAQKSAWQPIHAAILLAEDNMVNQDVAGSMLSELGCHVVVVSNGLEAVEQCEKTAFDMVFMDCQMPVMDGFEALKQIRERPTMNTQTPIVALTANAMQGDRERCLKAGMDDYLSKPMRQIQLYNMLQRWVGETAKVASRHEQCKDLGAPQMKAADTSPVLVVKEQLTKDQAVEVNSVSEVDCEPAEQDSELTDTAVNQSIINDQAIKQIQALQRPGRPSLLVKVLKVYLSKTPSLLSNMQLAIKESDYTALETHARTLASSSRYLGADGLADICSTIEQAATSQQDQDSAALNALVESFTKEYEKVEAQLHELAEAA